MDRFSDICLPILALKTVIVSSKCFKESYIWPLKISDLKTAKFKQCTSFLLPSGVGSFQKTFGQKFEVFSPLSI